MRLGDFERVLTELDPFAEGAGPFVLGHLAEGGLDAQGAHLFQGRGIVGLGVSGHRAEGDVVGPPLALGGRVDVLDLLDGLPGPLVQAGGTRVDQVDGAAEPAIAELEVVALDDVHAALGVAVGLEVLVLVVAEEAAEDDRLIGEAELVVVVPGGVPDQVGRPAIVLDALLDELDALLDPLVLVLGGVPLDGDVVGQVPALEGPDLEEVGLELGDPVDVGLEAVPVVVAAVLVGLLPEVVGHDPAEPAEQEELHHEAAGVDLADRRLAQVVALLDVGEPLAIGEHGAEEQDDDEPVDDLVLVASHAATSRFLRMKYPTIENGKA